MKLNSNFTVKGRWCVKLKLIKNGAAENYYAYSPDDTFRGVFLTSVVEELINQGIWTIVSE